jgi:nucleoporin NDC1
MWSQTYGVCVDVLKSLETRLDEYGKPPAAIPPAEENVEPRKRTTAPPREDNIFQTTPQKAKFVQEVEKVVNQVAVAPGQGSQLSPLAKRALATGKQQLLQAQKEITGSDDPRSVFKDLALKVLNSAVGWPFRREYGRRLAAAVLGTPYGEPSVYINTVSALSALALHSLSEDKYGNVQRDVATIIRTLTKVTKKLDKFSTDLTPHWTDMASRRESAEINEVLQTFKEALGQLVRAFEPYARELRLSMADIRMAKEAAVVVGQDRGPEMQQVG